MHRFPLIALALLLTASAQTVPKPPQQTYCQPVAFRDYEVIIGRIAVVRPLPGCTKPSLIRKVSDLSGRVDPPLFIPLPSPNLPLTRINLFFSHLEYSLDGRSYTRLRLQP